MRRLLSIAVVVLAAAVVAARSGMQAPEPEGEKKLIDLKSDLMGPIAPGDSVVFLVGNFAAQHNGAVITLLAVTGLTHRQSYKDIFAITCIKTAAVFVVIAVYYLTGIY